MKKITLLILSMVLLYSCIQTKQTKIFKAKEDNEIVNKYWKLKTLNGKAVKMTANQEREQYFILKNDNTMNGFAGCNHFNGGYELQSGNQIHFKENTAVSMKACYDDTIIESEFLEVFKIADNYILEGDTLRLSVGKRKPLAVFEAVYF